MRSLAEQIAARLDERFRLLTEGSREAPAHQQTLRATWSGARPLEPRERPLFRRLAVFAGGLTLELAEAVCAARWARAPEDGSRRTCWMCWAGWWRSRS